MSRWTARSSTRGSPTRLRRRFNYFLALTGSQELLIFVRSSGCFNFDSSQYSESTQRAITHTCHMWESRTMTSQINQTGNHRPGPWPSCSHAAWAVKTGQQQCLSVFVYLKYRPIGRCLQSCTSNWIIYSSYLIKDEDSRDAQCCLPPSHQKNILQTYGGQIRR